ncbi:MAG: AAA family ATPase, partial [Deltaproteobacteria bacterium]|nr:AAA family ATPase [Deltaproteobacteria bacterium]
NAVQPNPDLFDESLTTRLGACAKSHKIDISLLDPMTALSTLIENLSVKHADSLTESSGTLHEPRKNVVLLIDEYDFPLHDKIHDSAQCELIRLKLRNFYSAVKGSYEYLKFTFITGITKFQQVSLFSSLNNVIDLTLDSKFSEICGFTKQEILDYYKPNLEEAIPKLISSGDLPPESTVEMLMKVILNWYDGYSWDGDKTVLNPFSIKWFLENKKFKNYWYNSGTPLFVYLLNSKTDDYFKIFDIDLSIQDPIEVMDINNLQDESFLFQAGYLTIDKIDAKGTSPIHLKIPNLEVLGAISKEIAHKFLVPPNTSNPVKYINDSQNYVLSAFQSRNIIEAEKQLSSIFSSINKKLYHGEGENIFHVMLFCLLIYGDRFLQTEVTSDKGRADIIIELPDGSLMGIEVKHSPGIISSDDTASNDTPTSVALSASSFSSASGSLPSQINHADDQTVRPVSQHGDSYVLTHGLLTEKETKILSNLIIKAFDQIAEKNYTLPLLRKNRKVYAAAVAVYGTSKVMVRFADVVWKDDRKQTPSWNEISPTQGTISPVKT